MRDGTPDRAERRFERSLDSLKEISGFLDGFFEARRIGAGHLETVRLAVEEIFTNMLKYGRGSERILIGLELDGGELAVSLTDYDVEEFDPTAHPDVPIDRPLSEREPGGLGIHLVKRIMDRVEYDYVDGNGTTRLFKSVDG